MAKRKGRGKGGKAGVIVENFVMPQMERKASREGGKAQSRPIWRRVPPPVETMRCRAHPALEGKNSPAMDQKADSESDIVKLEGGGKRGGRGGVGCSQHAGL